MLVYHKGAKYFDEYLGEVASLLISHHITISWLYLPNGFRIILLLRDSASQEFMTRTKEFVP